jgi:diguanylate cyclase (GGDEF)-like protein
VRTTGNNGEYYLGKLAELGAALARSQPGSASFFTQPLRIVQEAMGFSLSVLYRVENRIEDVLILEVVEVLDPEARRPALAPGKLLVIDLARPAAVFRNEAAAFGNRGVAAENIAGEGCDLVGHVAAGEGELAAYLLGGDFVGTEADLQEADRRVFEIATGLMSALLLKAHFQHRADFDRLTGLWSSARIRAELEAALQRCARWPVHGLGVALIDLDHFKAVNDSRGHLEGDAALAAFGRLIASRLRAGQDHAGRFGGEEFLIILEDTAPDTARSWFELLRVSVERHFQSEAPRGKAVEAGVPPLTISIGACLLEAQAPGRPAREVLAAADRALYAAKRAGRNRVVAAGLP